MKLQAVTGSRVYASRGRTIVVSGNDRAFEPLGTLPNPLSGVGGLRYTLSTSPPWQSAIEWVVGAYQTTNVWPITDDVLVATVRRQLFVSDDGGRQWQRTHQLPASSGLAGVLPTAVCVQDGTIYLGEYPLDNDATPRILRSVDEGRSWTTVLELPEVRHVHAICADPYTGELWVTTGDRDAECHIGRLRNGTFETVGGGDQRWRAVDLVFTPSSLLWGMDCVYTARNRIFRLDRADIENETTRPTLGGRSRSQPSSRVHVASTPERENRDSSPRPTSVASVPNSVYFGATLTVDGTQWVVFSTAVEAGDDSTAPDRSVDSTTGKAGADEAAMVIAASAASDFTEWYELARFQTRTRPIEYIDPGGWFPVSNAYVFLGADAKRGLVVNPFNTATDHGRLITVSPGTIARVADGD